jgi:tRNA(Ile)-lysidine synthetase-like protein
MEELYNFWYENRNLWFNATAEDDSRINEIFGKFFDEIIGIEEMLENRKRAVGTVILYDQISRHISRANDKVTLFKMPIDKYNFAKKTSELAVECAEKVYSHYNHALFADEYVFVMLPLRHSYDFNKIKFVMSETWNRIKHERESSEIEKYRKFLKATYERTIKQSNDSQAIKFYPKNEKKEHIEENIKFKELYTKYREILDAYENTMLAEDIESELKLKYKKQVNLDFMSKFKEVYNKLPKVSFLMSISGGVDSMVCSYVLKKLNAPFKCVHINYNNRKESELEENFVIEWCNLINVDLYIRKIDEINRPICMSYNLREIYESYTRDVRYKTYINVDREAYVILGHNQDDCFENILTNISHKAKYDNLYGMSLISPIKYHINTINFVRPMLDIPKKEIYEFATVSNIPFLWDSTPKWSQRGKIRDEVRPTLESWDKEMVSGLFEVTNMLKESLELVDTLVNTWKEKIVDNILTCDKDDISNNKIFWKKLFEKKNFRVTTKSLEGFIELINKIKENKINVDINAFVNYELNKTLQIRIKKLKENKIEIYFKKRV